MKRKGLFLLGVLLAFGVVVFGGLRWMAGAANSHKVVLPNGTILTVEAISYGKNHILRGKGNRLVDQLLPPRQLDVYQSRQDELVLFVRQSPRSTVLQRNSLGQSPWASLDIRDEAGGFSRNVTASHSINHPDHVRLSTTSFPRRSKWLTLTFSDPQYNPLGTLRFANPAPAPPPQWMPDIFPITRTHDEIAFTLNEPKFIPHIYRPHSPFNSNQLGYTAREIAERGIQEGEILFRHLTFSVKENGKPSHDWGIWTVEEEDIYGQKTYRNTGTASSRLTDYYLSLPTNENVRVELVIQKRASAPIKPEEIWSFAPIVPPAEGKVVTLSKAKLLPNGVEMVKGEVTSAKAYKANARGYAVAFEVRGLPHASRFVLKAKDENGKFVGNSYARHWMDTDKMNNAPSSLFYQGKPTGVVRHTFVIEAKQPLKQLTLTARVLPGKYFHFTLPGTYKPPK